MGTWGAVVLVLVPSSVFLHRKELAFGGVQVGLIAAVVWLCPPKFMCGKPHSQGNIVERSGLLESFGK